MAAIPAPMAQVLLENGANARESGEDPLKTVEVLTASGDIRRLHDIQRDLLALAIEHYGGQVALAARFLGISRSSFYRKLTDFQIGRPAG